MTIKGVQRYEFRNPSSLRMVKAIFRPYKPGEESVIKAVILSVLGESGFEYDPVLNHDLDFLEEVYGFGNGRMFVIVVHGRIVGTAGTQDLGDGIARWRRLTVLSDYRGCGLGFQMQMHTIDYCRSADFVLARFDTLERFGMVEKYQSLGCTVVKREMEGEDVKVHMELVL